MYSGPTLSQHDYGSLGPASSVDEGTDKKLPPQLNDSMFRRSSVPQRNNVSMPQHSNTNMPRSSYASMQRSSSTGELLCLYNYSAIKMFSISFFYGIHALHAHLLIAVILV